MQAAPTLRAAFGIGVDVAAEMLILAGDNPDRVRSEAAFAKLCGACPIPASSGNTQRHRLNYAGHRQANSALYRSIIVRMRFHAPTIDYVNCAPPKARQNARSSAASSATSHARSTAPSAPHQRHSGPPRPAPEPGTPA